MIPQRSVLGGATSMIGSAALESRRPARRLRSGSASFEYAGPDQENLAGPLENQWQSQTQPPRGGAPALNASPPRNMEARLSSEAPALPAAPVPQEDAETASADRPVGRLAAERAAELGIAARAAAPGAHSDADAARVGIRVSHAEALPGRTDDSPAAVHQQPLLRRVNSFPESARHSDAQVSGKAAAADAQTAIAASATLLRRADGTRAEAASAPPVTDAEPQLRTRKETGPRAVSLDALSDFLKPPRRQALPEDQTAWPRAAPPHEPRARPGPPQVHIGTLEIRIEAPAAAKAVPARAPLPPSGPGIVSRMRLRSL